LWPTTSSIIEFPVVLPAKGRRSTGVRSKASTQESETLARTREAVPQSAMSRRQGRRDPSQWARANARSTTKAANILTLKPSPTRAIDRSRGPRLPVSVALIRAQAARSRTSTRHLSVLLERSLATLTGMMTRKNPARSPVLPKRRSTR
jgi:hypothetical protein